MQIVLFWFIKREKWWYFVLMLETTTRIADFTFCLNYTLLTVEIFLKYQSHGWDTAVKYYISQCKCVQLSISEKSIKISRLYTNSLFARDWQGSVWVIEQLLRLECKIYFLNRTLSIDTLSRFSAWRGQYIFALFSLLKIAARLSVDLSKCFTLGTREFLTADLDCIGVWEGKGWSAHREPLYWPCAFCTGVLH